jgi:hypothetical protein
MWLRRDTCILILPFNGDFLNSWKIYLESRASPFQGFDVDETSALLNVERLGKKLWKELLWRHPEN